jgi:hypothetical protein
VSDSAGRAHSTLFQAVLCFLLLLSGARICVIKWREEKEANLANVGYRSSESHSSASKSGGWPQFRFALLSALAGATGLGDCICTSFFFRYRYSAFCIFFASNCQVTTVGSKFDYFVDSALSSSVGYSASFWVSAVNSAVLNFVQLILIKRLFGTLVVADADWAIKVNRRWIFKCVERLPAALPGVIIIASATSFVAQTINIAVSLTITRAFRRFVVSALNASALLNDSVAEVVQVCRFL